jgi:hypothetical protein
MTRPTALLFAPRTHDDFVTVGRPVRRTWLGTPVDQLDAVRVVRPRSAASESQQALSGPRE